MTPDFTLYDTIGEEGDLLPPLALTGDVATFSKNDILLDLTEVGLETRLKNPEMNDDSIQEHLDTVPFESFIGMP